MGNKKFSFSKRLLLACAIVGVLAACMAVSAFAASYGIPDTIIADVDTNTATVTVTGAGSNQITIVVRKDNDNWVSDPNANVLYIDQVTGQGATTNITFGLDQKWLSTETYKVFVGGSGMTVASADFIYNDDVPKRTITFYVDDEVYTTRTVNHGGTLIDIPAVPEKDGFVGVWDPNNFSNITADMRVDAKYTIKPDNDFVVTKIYAESANLGQTGKLLIEGTLSSNNGDKKVVINGVELAFSTQRNLYVGLIDASAVVGGDIPAANVTITDATPIKFIYGDINNNGTFNAADVTVSRNYQVGNISTVNLLIAGDVNLNGTFNAADITLMKNVLAEVIPKFPALP